MVSLESSADIPLRIREKVSRLLALRLAYLFQLSTAGVTPQVFTRQVFNLPLIIASSEGARDTNGC
jgi:TRAP-type C4-dicarboxylate transport system permease small subunit